MPEPSAAGAGARCAIHPEARAERICERCGNFMCAECARAGAAELCPKCAALQNVGSFPLGREDWDFGRLWDYSWAVFKREWLMLTLAALIITIAGYLPSAVSTGVLAAAGLSEDSIATTLASMLSQVLSWVIEGILGMGMARMLLDGLEGKRAELGRLFSQFARSGAFLLQFGVVFFALIIPLFVYVVVVLAGALAAAGRLSSFAADPGSGLSGLGDHVAALVILGVGAVAWLPPFLYFALPLPFVSLELVHDPGVGGLAALRNAYRVARGKRLAILGVTIVQAGVCVAGFFALCIGVLPAVALSNLLGASLYLALRNGSGLRNPPLAVP